MDDSNKEIRDKLTKFLSDGYELNREWINFLDGIDDNKKHNENESVIVKYCKDCEKKWTKSCPIRVWGRSEGRNFIDVDPELDYCSRFIPTDEVLAKSLGRR